MTGVAAKKHSKTLNVREDWADVKLRIMYEICYIKFTQNPQLGTKLLATGDEPLIEGNEYSVR